MRLKFILAMTLLCALMGREAIAQSSRGFEMESYSLEEKTGATNTSYILQGEFYYRPGIPIVLTAPHGDFDLGTYEIVRALCDRHPTWTCVLARHFRSDGVATEPFNVNRPTLLNDDDCEHPNALASRIYGAWMGKVQRITPALYIEIHGNVRDESIDHIEVAHKGFSATQLKSKIGSSLFAVDEVDSVWFKATQNKKCGAFQQMGKALHFELPAQLRDSPENQAEGVEVLDKALIKIQSAFLP